MNQGPTAEDFTQHAEGVLVSSSKLHLKVLYISARKLLEEGSRKLKIFQRSSPYSLLAATRSSKRRFSVQRSVALEQAL